MVCRKYSLRRGSKHDELLTQIFVCCSLPVSHSLICLRNWKNWAHRWIKHLIYIQWFTSVAFLCKNLFGLSRGNVGILWQIDGTDATCFWTRYMFISARIELRTKSIYFFSFWPQYLCSTFFFITLRSASCSGQLTDYTNLISWRGLQILRFGFQSKLTDRPSGLNSGFSKCLPSDWAYETPLNICALKSRCSRNDIVAHVYNEAPFSIMDENERKRRTLTC